MTFKADIQTENQSNRRVAGSQNQSADRSWSWQICKKKKKSCSAWWAQTQIFLFFYFGFDSFDAIEIKHVWHFVRILEHIVYIWHVFLQELVFSATIYKVGKCLMPSVLKSVLMLKVV